jgi:hypothetical protein
MRILAVVLTTLALSSCTSSASDLPAPGTRVYLTLDNEVSSSGVVESISESWVVLRNDKAGVTTWYSLSRVRLMEVRTEE